MNDTIIIQGLSILVFQTYNNKQKKKNYKRRHERASKKLSILFALRRIRTSMTDYISLYLFQLFLIGTNIHFSVMNDDDKRSKDLCLP